MWQRKQRRPPSTYEDVRKVAEVLSRTNAALIEKHFAVSTATAQEFMERLVTERLFRDLQPDGWHYPLTRSATGTSRATIASTRCVDWLRRNCIPTTAMAAS